MDARTAAEGFAWAAERGLLPIAYAGARGVALLVVDPQRLPAELRAVLAAPAPTVRGWVIAGLARRLERDEQGGSDDQ